MNDQKGPLLAIEVAKYLKGWKIEPDLDKAWRGARIQGPDKAEVFISVDWRDKGCASGCFPADSGGALMSAARWGLVPYNQENDECTIGFNPGKDPERIARDIERRLLPIYLPMSKVAHEKLAEQVANNAVKSAQMLAMGEAWDSKTYGDNKDVLSDETSGGVYFKVNQRYSGSYDIRLTGLSYDDCLRMAVVAKELEGDKDD